MAHKMDTLRRMAVWFMVILAGMVTDFRGLAEFSPVRFPSDSALKVHLPEWIPKERGARGAQNRNRNRYRYDDSQEYAIKIKDPKPGENRQRCPEFSQMQPCTCKEKGSGLDVTCENVETSQLQKVTKSMKAHTQKNSYQIGYFKVRNSRIRQLPDYIFMGLKIVHLMLFDCGLETLMPNSLSSLAGSLKHLVLSNNDLNHVPTMALRQLRELDHVNLNQNNISHIKDGAFWGLSKVTRLTLYDNKINYIHPDAFDGLTKWTGKPTNQSSFCSNEDSDPNFNSLECVANNTKGDLLRLNVGRNSLTEIPSESLEMLKNLNQLDLSFNKIKEIKENTFLGLDKLDTLNLDHNKIEVLYDDHFEGMPKVTSLSLDYNKIYEVHPGAFNGLDEQLQFLSLAANKISSVPTAALSSLHQLNTLHLNDNNISRLKEDSFEGFGEHLHNLWLQNNKICDIPPGTFEDLTTLEWVKLNNNELTTVHYELIEPVLSTLKHIDIYKNPLICDCEMKWYKRWWGSGWQNVDTDHLKDITCKDVEDGKEHLMKDVNLEHMYCVTDIVNGSTPMPSSAILSSSLQKIGLLICLIIHSLVL